MRSGVSQGPWTVKIADIFPVSGGWRAVGRNRVTSLCRLTADPFQDQDFFEFRVMARPPRWAYRGSLDVRPTAINQPNNVWHEESGNLF